MNLARGAAIAPFLAMRVAAEAAAREADGARLVRFDVGQPSAPAPPAALAAAAAALADSPLGYTPVLGAPALRAAIAAHMAGAYGVDVDPGRVVVTTGASGAFVLAFLALFAAGDRVALAAPGYPPYRHILTALGRAPAIADADPAARLQLTPAHLDELARAGPLRGALIASPANPTGAMLDRPALLALSQAARAHGAALISDEIYHGLTYEGPAISALEVDPDAVVINSFSKYWAMTGWRVGWLIAPEALIEPIDRLAQNLFICPPAIAQTAALAALTDTAAPAARLALYAANRARLLQALPQLGFAPVTPPDGAFYILADVSAHTQDSHAWCRELLDRAGVALTPGVDFCPRRGGRWVRLSYAREAAEIEEGLARLAAAL